MLNEENMKTTIKPITGLYGFLISVATISILVSCSSTPKTTESKSTPPQYTRIAFAEQLGGLLEEKKTDEAIALFDSVPEPDASDPAIKMLKLSILVSARKLEEATALAEELAKARPNDPEILYVQAIISTAKNETAKRTGYLEEILKIDPRHSLALTGLALDFLSKKNYPKAKELLIKAIASDPENTDALLGLARVYYMQADLAKAGDTLNLALEKDPGYSILWAERARVKSESRDLAGALKDISHAISIDPDIHSHWMDYGTYLISTTKKTEAREAFSRAIELEPSQHLAYIYRGGLNDDLDNIDGAIYDYRKVCQLYPQYFYAAESLGVLLWKRQEYAEARHSFLIALEGNPTNISYALMMTLCSYRQGKTAEARDFMTKYINTLDRASTEYFLCRLFVDKSGDGDVLNRIMKEKDINIRNRMLFYSAMYYDLFVSKNISQKYFMEITSIQAPNFFEYSLSLWELKGLENTKDTENGHTLKS